MHHRLALLIVGVVALVLVTTVNCTGTRTTPVSTIESTPVSIPTYIAEIERALVFISDTLEVAAEASLSLAENQITREEYREMAVAGKHNLEIVEEDMNGIVPPYESIKPPPAFPGVHHFNDPASFADAHNYLLLGIKDYKKAFDEMIKYGDDGKLFHIQEATTRIENYGNPHITTVKSELRILKKEFLK